MQHSVYLPGDVENALTVSGLRLNLSGLLQQAIMKEIKMQEATNNQEFEKITMFIESEDRAVAFQGRRLGYHDDFKLTVYITPKGNFVVDDRINCEYSLHPDFDHLVRRGNIPGVLAAEVAKSLGTNYIEELDI